MTEEKTTAQLSCEPDWKREYAELSKAYSRQERRLQRAEIIIEILTDTLAIERDKRQ